MEKISRNNIQREYYFKICSTYTISYTLVIIVLNCPEVIDRHVYHLDNLLNTSVFWDIDHKSIA